MDDTDAARGQVATDAAEIYDRFFVPALFAQWTATMLDAAQVRPGDRVLDVGSGTGVLARAASARVGSTGSVVGLDPNDGMRAVAARHPEPVTWQAGVVEQLPFADRTFDRAVSQFVWMFLDDPDAAARELARVVAPGGSIAVATWCAVEESPGYASMVEILEDVVGTEAAQALLAPFRVGSADALRALLVAQFPDVVVTRYEGVATFESIDAWVQTDIRGWTLTDMIDHATFERVLTAARERLVPFVGADGRVAFAAPALVATANAA